MTMKIENKTPEDVAKEFEAEFVKMSIPEKLRLAAGILESVNQVISSELKISRFKLACSIVRRTETELMLMSLELPK